MAAQIAWNLRQAICAAQGGMREPPVARHAEVLVADRAGSVVRFDNRRLGRLAKLAGAPRARSAGLVLHVRMGVRVQPGQPLFTLHAEAAGELRYAMDFFETQPSLIELALE